MLNAFLYDGPSAMDLIHLAPGRQLRSCALEGWNRVKPKEPGCLQKDPDMAQLEKYMDRLTDAKRLHKAPL